MFLRVGLYQRSERRVFHGGGFDVRVPVQQFHRVGQILRSGKRIDLLGDRIGIPRHVDFEGLPRRISALEADAVHPPHGTHQENPSEQPSKGDQDAQLHAGVGRDDHENRTG